MCDMKNYTANGDRGLGGQRRIGFAFLAHVGSRPAMWTSDYFICSRLSPSHVHGIGRCIHVRVSVHNISLSCKYALDSISRVLVSVGGVSCADDKTKRFSYIPGNIEDRKIVRSTRTKKKLKEKGEEKLYVETRWGKDRENGCMY